MFADGAGYVILYTNRPVLVSFLVEFGDAVSGSTIERYVIFDQLNWIFGARFLMCCCDLFFIRNWTKKVNRVIWNIRAHNLLNQYVKVGSVSCSQIWFNAFSGWCVFDMLLNAIFLCESTYVVLSHMNFVLKRTTNWQRKFIVRAFIWITYSLEKGKFLFVFTCLLHSRNDSPFKIKIIFFLFSNLSVPSTSVNFNYLHYSLK